MRCVSVIFALCLAMPASAQYAVTRTYPLGGEGGWDYVIPDPPRHRLFIARQNRVMVVDERSGKLLDELSGIHGAHGVALAGETGRGFATSSEDSSIYIFDAKSLRILGRVPAAEDADAIVYDAATDRVFSFNGDAHNATVVDARAGKLVRNLPLGGKPESGVVAGNGKVYVNLTDVSEVVEIDARTLNVARRWSTAPCKQPVAMAIDVVHGRLFSGCRSGVAAISDIAAGTVVTTLPIGQGVDGAAFDAATSDAFFSNIDGTLTVIHEDSPNAYHVVQTLPTIERGRNMGLDPSTHQLFVVGAKFGPTPAESTAANPRRRPPMIPGSFTLLVIERQPGADRSRSDSIPRTRRSVLIGALVGAVVGGVLYARTAQSDDGDFAAGLSIPVYVVGGVVVGALVGYVVSVSIERGQRGSKTAWIIVRRTTG